MKGRIKTKLLPIDYAVIVGGPLICLLIIWFGIQAIVGPAPRPNPVKLLREGAIEIGARSEEVIKKLGAPTQIREQEDGGFTYIYTRTVYEEATKSDSLDEGAVDFTPTGRVQSIRFDRSAPPSTSGT